MGTTVNGIYLPGHLEQNWDDEVNNNLRRLGDLGINVKAFDAQGDGVQDDTAAIQAAIDAWPSRGGALLFPPGAYKVSSTLQLPITTDDENWQRRHISGHGATIKTTAAIPVFKRNVTTLAQANGSNRESFVVEGLTILGNKTAGQTGFELRGSYGSVFRDCRFNDLQDGLVLTFALMARVDSCLASGCTRDSFVAQSGNGILTNGTTDNSGSNHTVFEQCRVYGEAGQNAEYRIDSSSGVEVRNCIAEGGNPVYNVYVVQGGSVQKWNRISNLHSENTPTGAVILANTANLIEIEALWHQTAAILVDATGSNAAALIKVINLPYIPANATFKHQGAGAFNHRWYFEFPGTYAGSNVDIRAAALWAGGLVPAYLNFMKVRKSDVAMEFGDTNYWVSLVGPVKYFQNTADANPRAVLADGAAGLQFGDGGASAVDTQIRRQGAGFVSVPMLVKAGVPADGDFTVAPPNGTLAINSSTNKIYCRIGGVWTQVTA